MAHTPAKTMVCVTVQRTCERLIREGAGLAGQAGLSVVHVVKPGGGVLGTKDTPKALEYLFQISRTYGAEMDVVQADDVVGTLVDLARKNDVKYVVIGQTVERGRTDIAAQLAARLPGVQMHIVP